MSPLRLLLSITALCAMLPVSGTATAATISYEWMTAEVTITHPDAVVTGEPFDISFAIDTSTADAGITLTFETFLNMSNTIDISNATWEYLFISDDPVWNLSFNGNLGDATTPTTLGPGSYSSRLYDPVHGNYTWLWSDYDDQVVWTLHDLVMFEDTSFEWTVERFLAAPVGFAAELPLASVPALSPLALLATGLGLLAASRSAPPGR